MHYVETYKGYKISTEVIKDRTAHIAEKEGDKFYGLSLSHIKFLIDNVNETQYE